MTDLRGQRVLWGLGVQCAVEIPNKRQNPFPPHSAWHSTEHNSIWQPGVHHSLDAISETLPNQ